MNNEKYLPIGTVVLLKDGSKKIMIIGFLPVAEESNKSYDYAGCLYPEGLLSSSATLVFNHDQIEKIFYLGFSDEEQKQFISHFKK